MTVGELKRAIEDLPNDVDVWVTIERTDKIAASVYFEPDTIPPCLTLADNPPSEHYQRLFQPINLFSHHQVGD